MHMQGADLSTFLSLSLPCSFTFMVHPAGFLVHRQHGRSSADNLYFAQKRAYEEDVKRDPALGRSHTSPAGMVHR